ncbi:PHP domain-containing protein [Legionella sp. W05-934-2]|uniref:PHP domain-containing protein n=1 Tax=Legionella sp. W05-934-2 TaxID=1198649 RepID=UPI003462CC68
MIDLHCHSTYSDGFLSVTALSQQALSRSVTMLALTDHDTVAGVSELQQITQDKPITIIPGIEISIRWNKHDIHILGLQIDIDNPLIKEVVVEQKLRRRQRANSIAESLAQLGVPDPLRAAIELAGHDHLARPHFAQVLVNAGYVKDRAQAFKRYLKRGRPAYHACQWISLAEAVHAIKGSGGIAVLAHPQKYGLTQTKLRQLIEEFKDVGGEGIEVVSGNQNIEGIKLIAAFCQEYGMLASSGSDFHGGPETQVGLGGQPKLPENIQPVWSLWTT